MKKHNTIYTVLKKQVVFLFSATLLLSSQAAMAQLCDTDAGTDVTVCSADGSFILSGNLNGSTGIWSTNGSGTIANPTSETPTYVMAIADYGTTLTFTLTNDQTGCSGGTLTDDVLVTIENRPQINSYASESTLCETTASGSGFTLNSGTLYATGVQWMGSGTFFPSATEANPTYIPTSLELAEGSAYVTVETTGHALSCAAATSDVNLYIDELITVDAGADYTVCANVTSVALNGSSNAGEVNWSGGAGFFSSPSDLTTDYTPAGGETYGGVSITFTLYASTSSACGAPSDDVVITFTAPEPINLDHPNSFGICKSVASATGIDIVATTAAPGLLWNLPDGSTTTTGAMHYDPTTAQITDGGISFNVITTGDPCGSSSQVINVNMVNDPTLAPISPITACGLNPINLSAIASNYSFASWTGGLGYFSGCTSCVSTTYNPDPFETTAGSNVVLTLTVTGYPGCTLTVAQNLTINFPVDAPKVEITTNGTICNSPTLSLTATSETGHDVTWSGGIGTFDNPNSLTPVYTFDPSEQGDGYSVYLTATTVNNGTCPAGTYSTSFYMYDAPTVVDAGSDQTLCASQLTAMVSETIVGFRGQGTWSTSGTGTFKDNSVVVNPDVSKPGGYTYTPSTADRTGGSVILTYTYTGPCAVQADNLILTFIPASLTVNAGLDQTVCSTQIGGADIILTGTTDAVGTPIIQWYAPLAVGTISNSDQLNASYTLDGSDAGNDVYIVLSVDDGAGCGVTTDTVMITVNNEVDIIFPAGDYNICAGDTFQLAAYNVDAITWSTGGAGEFLPNENAPFALYVPAASETSVTFSAQTTALQGCADVNVTSPDALSVFALPVVNAGADQSYCSPANDIVTLSATPVVSSPSQGIWTSNSANVVFTDGNDANTTVDITTLNGTAELAWTYAEYHNGIKGEEGYCVNSDTVIFTHLHVLATNKDLLTAPAGVQKTLDVTTNDNYYTALYDQTYTVALLNQGKYPGINVMSITEEGLLSFNNHTPFLAGKDTVIYQVTMACGLTGNDTIIVNLVNGPPIELHPALADTTVQKVPNVTIVIEADFSAILYDYNDNIDWGTFEILSSTSGVKRFIGSDGIIQFQYSSQRAAVFTGRDEIEYVVYDEAGDSVVGRYYVEILPDYENPTVKPKDFQVINAVSPNGDGVNDYMYVYGLSEYHNTVIIYNRWSQKVWEGENYDNNIIKFEGNGNVHGLEGQLPEGTYYYVVKNEGKDENDEKTGLYSGYIEIRR